MSTLKCIGLFEAAAKIDVWWCLSFLSSPKWGPTRMLGHTENWGETWIWRWIKQHLPILLCIPNGQLGCSHPAPRFLPSHPLLLHRAVQPEQKSRIFGVSTYRARCLELPGAHSRTFKAVSKQQILHEETNFWIKTIIIRVHPVFKNNNGRKEFHQQKPLTIHKHVYSALLHFHTSDSSWIQKAISHLLLFLLSAWLNVLCTSSNVWRNI